MAMGGYDGTAATQSASAIASIRFGFGYYSMILSLGIAVIAFSWIWIKQERNCRNTCGTMRNSKSAVLDAFRARGIKEPVQSEAS